jgi:hypothetical protein
VRIEHPLHRTAQGGAAAVAVVGLLQATEQRLAALAGHEAVGETQVQGIAGVELGAGQAQVGAHPRWHAVEEPTGADVRIEPDGDLRQGNAGGLGDQALEATGHQPQAAAHDDAVAPYHQRLGVGVDAVIEVVLGAEIGLGEQAVATGTAVLALLGQRTVERHHVAAGAEGLVAAALEPYRHDAAVHRPGVELGLELADHLQGEGVEGLGRIQGRHADAPAVTGGQLVEAYGKVRHRVCLLTAAIRSRRRPAAAGRRSRA